MQQNVRKHFQLSQVPGKYVSTSFNLPTGVQLLTVYADVTEIRFLEEHKIPVVSNYKNIGRPKVRQNFSFTSTLVFSLEKVAFNALNRLYVVIDLFIEFRH